MTELELERLHTAMDNVSKAIAEAQLTLNQLQLAAVPCLPSEIQHKLKTLSKRERQVMGEVATGKQNKQIAHEIGVCEQTVKQHRGHLMHKLGIRSVADLVRIVERERRYELT
jgi:FixJ family two-component response regulator